MVRPPRMPSPRRCCTRSGTSASTRRSTWRQWRRRGSWRTRIFAAPTRRSRRSRSRYLKVTEDRRFAMDRFAHLQWPFFDEKHRKLAREAEAWAKDNLSHAHGDDTDRICKRLVQDLGCAGFLNHVVGESVDVRSAAVLREIFAYHAGLADFAFVMQGLGSGPIALAGTEEPKKY